MAAAPSSGAVLALGRFTAALRDQHAPAAVHDELVLRIVDTVAAQLHGVHGGHGRLILQVLDAPGRCPVWGTAEGRSQRDAVAINAALAHAAYFEDGSRFTGGHPGSAVIPAALTMAMESGASGARLLDAIAAGYEVFLRLGRMLYPETVRRGFQSTAILAAPATAAAASVLMDLDAGQAANAIAIACSQSAGLKESLRCVDSQPLQVGRSSEGGIVAALMAARGATGSSSILEKGYLPAFGGQNAGTEDALDDLGERWSLAETYVKLHGGCRGNHAPVDAALTLARSHGIQPTDIARIDIAVDSVTRAAAIEPPANAAQAQSSIGFSVAVALWHGDVSPARFDAATLADAPVQALMRRIHVAADASLDTGFPVLRPAVVRCRLRDGRALEQRMDLAHGEPEMPLQPHHIVHKFQGIAPTVLGKGRSAALLARLRSLSHAACDEVRTLSDLLSPCAPASFTADPAVP